MKRVDLFTIAIFIVSSVWISLWVAPQFPDLIKYLLITAPVGLMGFTFYPISRKLFQLLLIFKQSSKSKELDEKVVK